VLCGGFVLVLLECVFENSVLSFVLLVRCKKMQKQLQRNMNRSIILSVELLSVTDAVCVHHLCLVVILMLKENEMGQGLTQEDIHKIQRTALEAGLDRNALLSGISRGFVGSLPTQSTPNAQLLTDLNHMNDVDELTDGTNPLQIWLQNAKHLSSSRKESQVFEESLRGLTNHPTPQRNNAMHTETDTKIDLPIFISYARKDKTLVENLMGELEVHFEGSKTFDFGAWRDSVILVGEGWDKEIKDAINASKAGILFLSPAFFTRKYIKEEELPRLLDGQKVILPVLLKPYTIHTETLGLHQFQYFSMETDNGKRKAFSECSSSQHKEKFVRELYDQIERRLQKEVG
tara:strand:+ start:91 stop:1128 length:1038 start_codon:yes stop_codon:yes gene_type:complete